MEKVEPILMRSNSTGHLSTAQEIVPHQNQILRRCVSTTNNGNGLQQNGFPLSNPITKQEHVKQVDSLVESSNEAKEDDREGEVEVEEDEDNNSADLVTCDDFLNYDDDEDDLQFETNSFSIEPIDPTTIYSEIFPILDKSIDIEISFNQRCLMRNPLMTNFEKELASNLHVTNECIEIETLMRGYNSNFDENFIKSIEEILPNILISLAKIKIRSDDNFTTIIDKLIKLAFDSLDYTYLIKEKFQDQEKLMFKLRQLKLGLNLGIILCSQINESIAEKMLNKSIQDVLLNLYDHDLVFGKLKILILEALYATIYFESGLKKFLDKSRPINQIPYKRLVISYLKNESFNVRISNTIEIILKRVNIYENLSNLSLITQKLVDSKSISIELKQEINKIFDKMSIYLLKKNNTTQRHVKNKFIQDENEDITHFIYLMKKLDTLKHFGTLWSFNYHDFKANIESIISSLSIRNEFIDYLALNKNLTNFLFKIMGSSEVINKIMTLLKVIKIFEHLNNILNEKNLIEILTNLQLINALMSDILLRKAIAELITQKSEYFNIILTAGEFNCKNTSIKKLLQSIVIDILYQITRYSDNIEFFQSYSNLIKYFIQNHQATSKTLEEKLKQIQNFIKPYSKTNPEMLLNSLQNKFCFDHLSNMPKSILSILKLFYFKIETNGIVTKNPFKNYNNQFSTNQFMLSLIHNNALLIFTNLFVKINECLLYNWKKSIQISYNTSLFLKDLLILMIKLVKLLLSKCVDLKKDKFQNLTLVKILLQLITFYDSNEVKQSVIDLLSIFCKYHTTRLFKEIFEFTVELPLNYFAGFEILIESLPLPLPLVVASESCYVNADSVMSHRELIGESLNEVAEDVTKFIQYFALSSNSSILLLLKHVCVRICDISRSCTLLVVKSLLDFCCDKIEILNERQDGDALRNMSHIFNFLTILLSESIPMFTFIHAIKQIDKYRSLFRCILNYCSFKLQLVTSQDLNETLNLFIESLFYFIQHICSFQFDKQDKLLLNLTIADLEMLKLMVNLLVQHLSHTYLSSLNTSVCVLNTLNLLCKNDYGFELVIHCLLLNSNSLYNFIDELSNLYAQDSRTISLIASLFGLINTLVSRIRLDGVNGSSSGSRLSLKRFKDIFKWIQGYHPLYKLCDIYESGNTLIRLLQRNQAIDANDEHYSYFYTSTGSITEPNFLNNTDKIDYLSEYFNKRSIIIVKKHFSYKNSQEIVKIELSETTNEELSLDIEDILINYLPNFRIEDELAKPVEKNYLKTKIEQSEVINTRTGFKYKAPMRGGHSQVPRGLCASALGLINRNDPFRSRQPNTSRPPSLHVDDFYRLQNVDLSPLVVPQTQRPMPIPGVNMIRSRFLMPHGTYSSNI